MSILELIKSDNVIYANRSLARIIGLNETIMLGELIYKFEYFEDKGELFEIQGLGKGFFYTTHDELEFKTLQGRTAQRRSVRNLKKLKFITTFFNSKEARVYFRVERKAIEDFLKSNDLAPVSPKKKQIKQKFIPVQSEQGGCSICTPNDIYNDTLHLREENDIVKTKPSQASPPPPPKPSKKKISLSSHSEENIDIDTLVLEDGRPASKTLKLYLHKLCATNTPRFLRNYRCYLNWIAQGKTVKKSHEELLQWMIRDDIGAKEENKDRNRMWAKAIIEIQNIKNAKVTNRSVNFYSNGLVVESIELTLPRESFDASFNKLINQQRS